MEKESKNYEIAFLTKSEEDRQEIASVIKSHQISVVDEEKQPSKIRLAYPIKKENYAFFEYLRFSAPPQETQKLKKELEKNQKILRFFITGSQPAAKTVVSDLAKSVKKIMPAKTATPADSGRLIRKRTEGPPPLSNEALEKKLEEILK